MQLDKMNVDKNSNAKNISMSFIDEETYDTGQCPISL